MRMAFTKDGRGSSSSGPERWRSRRTIAIRDAATLKPIGRPIEPEAFAGAYVFPVCVVPHFVLTADDRSLVTASEDGELAWWDLGSRRKTRTVPINAGLSRARAQPRRSHRGGRYRRRHPARGRADRNGATATAGFTGSPNWLLFSPDGETVVSTNLDGTVTLWDARSATPARRCAATGTPSSSPSSAPTGRRSTRSAMTEPLSPGT